MRRDNVDGPSQPVRNLVSSPDMERTSGTTATRQNLMIYPNFESSAAVNTVRSNLMGNPRGVYAMSQYSAPGAQVITANVAITGHPEGLTTANRFTYGGTTPANPGVQFFNGTPGTNYTMSAWIYIESLCTTPGNTGWAESGVLSGPNFPNTVGVWQKVVWNRTPTSGNGIGIRTAGADGGSASILITGIVIEAAPVGFASTTFFDGATPASGDFTYAWSGTPHASISNQRAVWATGWAGSSAAVAYQSSVSPVLGTKCCAVLTKGGNGDGLYHSSIYTGISQFSVYTMSAWIKLTAAQPSMYLVARWVDNAANIIADHSLNVISSLVVGQWVRVSASFTAPAGAVRLDPQIRCFNTHTPTLFYVDAVMVENNNVLSDYFDGSTANVGDFTRAWYGGANTSQSVETAPSVGGYSGWYSGGRIAWQSTEWSASGTKSLAVAGLRPNLDSFSQIAPLPNMGTLGGKTFTFLANLRTMEAFPTGADGRAWSINISVNLSGGGQFQYNIKPTTTFMGVHEIKQTLKFRDDATTLNYIRLYNGSPNYVNVFWDNFMIVEGTYTGDYVDGSKPFSKWDGTAQASTSVGYSQQFLDIAGKPAVDIVGTGSVNNTGVPDPFMGRSIYCVHETTNNTGNYNVCASYGIVGSKGFMIQTATAGSNNMANRYDLPGGTFNGGLVLTARTNRRHVQAFAFNDGLTSVVGCANGGSDVGQVVNPGTTGFDDSRAICTANAEFKSVRFIVFNAFHDRATRIAMSRYLGNKYGAPVA